MIVPYMISHVKDKQMRKVKGKDINLVLRLALSAPCNSIRTSPENGIKFIAMTMMIVGANITSAMITMTTTII